MKASFFALSVLATSALACEPCETLEKAMRKCASGISMPTSVDQAKALTAQVALCACTKENTALLTSCKACPPSPDMTKQALIATMENSFGGICQKVMGFTGGAGDASGAAGGAVPGGADPGAGGAIPGSDATGAGGMPPGGMPGMPGQPGSVPSGAPVPSRSDAGAISSSISSAVSSAVAPATSSAESSASSEASTTASTSPSATKNAAVGSTPVGASGFALLATFFGFLAAL